MAYTGLNLTQEQTLNQFQVQSLDVLTMESADLAAKLEKMAETNPLLVLRSKAEGNVRYSASVSQRGKEAAEEFNRLLESVTDDGETLYQHMTRKIGFLKLSDEEAEMARLIASDLNGRGFLTHDADTLLENFQFPDKRKTYYRMCDLISRIEPIGCACENVYESLKKQLSIKFDITDKNVMLAYEMINQTDFEHFAKGNVNHLSKKYSAKEDSVREAFSMIKSLNPNPAAEYSGNTNREISPSIELKIENNEIKITVNDEVIPEVSRDDTYDSAKNLSAKDKKFISKCTGEINAFKQMMENRNRIISRIAHFVISMQLGYLLGKKPKRPLLLKTIADYAEVSISTASRIMNSNYLRFGNKVIPMRSLLEKEGKGSTGRNGIIQEIGGIIKASDAKLSDEKIRAALHEKGIDISRRTVQKYRQELGIGSSHNR